MITDRVDWMDSQNRDGVVAVKLKEIDHESCDGAGIMLCKLIP